jgi:hypothetical protein
MSDAKAAIGYERRRQVQVREVFEAGLALRNRDDLELAGFFLACAAYIVFSMDRLHHQDQVIHDLLAERIAADDMAAHERLDDLAERQGKSRELIEQLQRVAEELTADLDALGEFEDTAVNFVDAFSSLMAPRKNPFEKYTDELFTDEDWIVIAGVTDESRLIEKELYAAVQVNAPDGLEPETAVVVYH